MKKLLLLSLSFLLISVTQIYAQNRTVTGTVTSKDDGLPIPGASVKLQGAKTGTITSSDGKYSLQAKPGDVLVFSFIGYSTTSKTIGASGTVNATLTVDSKQLSEVVVTSFGIERSKKSLGYSTTNISATSMTATQNTNFTNSLEAKVPGVQVSGSGGAFTGSSILIRGNVTFTGNNQPLIVVDGLPIDNGGGNSPLQSGPSVSNRGIDLNPEDIETTTVLKGAAATVLYGSRAASGAILITTKKGTKGAKAQIEYSGSYGIGNPDRLPNYQNTYGQGNNGVYNNTLNTSWGPEMKGQLVTNFFGNQEALVAYPNNVKDFFVTAKNVQNNISLNGGNDKTTYRVSYGNDYNTYVIDNNTLRRNNITANVRTEITPKLRVGTSFSYINNISSRTQQGNQLSNPLFRAWFTPRSYNLQGLPYENADGTQNYYGTTDNPYWTINHNKYHDETNRILGNVDLTYDILSWLNADLKVGEDYYGTNNNSIDDIGNKGGGNTGGSSVGVGGVGFNQNTYRNTDAYFTLNGTRNYGDFNFALTLGSEMLDNYQNYNQQYGYTLSVPGFDNLSNASTYVPTNASYHYRIFGVFGDFVVDYKKWLTLNVKSRNDWNSTLAPGKQSIFYPAAALSFLLTDAIPSLKSNTVNQIKLRANYGRVGKGPTDFLYSTSNRTYLAAGSSDGFGPTISFPFNGTSGFGINTIAGNPNLTPEFTTEIEFGGEFGFFNNRLTIDGSYYTRKSKDLILQVPVSNASGLGAFTQNAGSIKTNGVEFAINGTPIKSRDFSWNIGTTFTHFVSTVQSLAPGVSNIFLGGFTTPNIRLVAGDQYGQIYGSAYQRDANGQMIIGANGLPKVTTDVQKIGNPNPKYILGINNTFAYKGINLYFLFDIKKGGDLYSRNYADVQRNGVAAETATYPRFNADGSVNKPYIFQGVLANGQANTTYVSAQNYYGNSGKYVAAEGYIYDTSWFRLRELNLSYSLPKGMLDHSPFGRASIGVYGRNLFLITPHFRHFDPEQNALGINNAQGLEFNSLPSLREIGVNLRFTL
ncbi:SusC/RagA family TonB-linked outer membrane protein [Mucilaginibacter polytrichastri]|uniref:TonB-dependent receptor plug domain-containing protein n=1 Tax=Mucilaginibacter polytrichastri TaxID=1302689 RepID=A0A1Q6A552_9SPHI|nr:SusC/RagA family TonB-linked outer membrane protein [Mucilaginibacter polytrichastri]OKS89140.1 hypothetical protein RG47T_4621 [Mucilaginibacter polytrichastri]SFS97032.1 TonB-linked outer membrane protein, SusC/RagA family [Mucilaginibacter polytrichastri]